MFNYFGRLPSVRKSSRICVVIAVITADHVNLFGQGKRNGGANAHRSLNGKDHKGFLPNMSPALIAHDMANSPV